MSLASYARRTIISIIGSVGILACGISSSATATATALDLVSKSGVTFGGAVGGAGGKFVPWGGSVVLSEADAFVKSNGKCAFNVSYDLENLGSAPTATPFKN